MTIDGQYLLNLLPALYRLRDAEVAAAQGVSGTAENPAAGPLEALLTLIAEQFALVADDLDQLYDNQFIETCAPWVIPYIGDLIGFQAVNGIAPAVASPRAEVAHTISFRRRKGTILMIEQLARDVTGWGAHAVESFRLLTVTQYMNHIRPDSGGTPDLRNWQVGEFLNTAFDAVAHNVDVRDVASGRGRYNIPNIGIFLWSLQPYSLTNVPATPVTGAANCFRLNTLGIDMPLFTQPAYQGIQVASAAQPVNVPDRLSRRMLCEDLRSGSAPVFYGNGNSLTLSLNGTAIAPAQIIVANLSGADGQWKNLPAAGSPFLAAVDPQLGRVAVAPPAAGATAPSLRATFSYGFNGDIGGGPYPRESSFPKPPGKPVVSVPGQYPTIHQAIAALSGVGVVEITDSGIYSEPVGLTIAVNANQHIELRAADGARPTLLLGAPITVTGGSLSACDINGLLIACTAAAPLPPALVHVPAGATNTLAHLGLTHCTLVPGWSLSSSGVPQSPAQPAVVAEASGLALVLTSTISGALLLQPTVTAAITDSLIDATSTTGTAYAGLDGASAGGPLTLSGCTVIGKVHATLFTLISNSVITSALAPADTWAGPLWSDRRQQGCVRYSCLPAGSIVPQPYACVFAGAGGPLPRFAGLHFGSPGYGKLLPSTPDRIRRGADDGGEMGAFHFLLAPLRESDLKVRIAEYLAVGMECGLFYAT